MAHNEKKRKAKKMAKRKEIGSTCDMRDCTRVGWIIQVTRERCGTWAIVAQTHTRWQGSRNGVEFWLRGYDTHAVAIEDAEAILTHHASDDFAMGDLVRLARYDYDGVLPHGWTAEAPGYFVR